MDGSDGRSKDLGSSDGKNGVFFSKTLVLNSTFAPINICSWRRAMTLLFKKKAEVIEKSLKLINNRYPSPLVIRLMRFAPVPFVSVVLTRKNVYLRDNGACQYCGHSGGGLTIDHVIPKSKGGVETWENIVVACVRCNNKKGDRTASEAGLKLQREPYRPPSPLYLQITRLPHPPESWFHYFFGKDGDKKG